MARISYIKRDIICIICKISFAFAKHRTQLGAREREGESLGCFKSSSRKHAVAHLPMICSGQLAGSWKAEAKTLAVQSYLQCTVRIGCDFVQRPKVTVAAAHSTLPEGDHRRMPVSFKTNHVRPLQYLPPLFSTNKTLVSLKAENGALHNMPLDEDKLITCMPFAVKLSCWREACVMGP
jgi:hypothetical protein